jgi:hypothetical protein
MLLTRLAVWPSIGFILTFLFILPAYPHGGELDGMAVITTARRAVITATEAHSR